MRVFTVPSHPVIVTPAGSVMEAPGKRGSVITWAVAPLAIGTKRSSGGGGVMRNGASCVAWPATSVTSTP